ncbi:hypothetical protein SC08_Contig83orf01630 [Clostridium butyricum]|nr:hypothetical protein SC08_Contig83orf01630 [Clostridium butyricum]
MRKYEVITIENNFDIEKLSIELFLNNYNREINRIKRKLEFEIIKETLY